MTWELTVYVPPTYTWSEAAAGASGFGAISNEAPLLRAKVSFEKSDRVDWSLRFAK